MVVSIALSFGFISFSFKGQEASASISSLSKKIPCWSSGTVDYSNRYVECGSCILVSGIPKDGRNTCNFEGQEKDSTKQQKYRAKQKKDKHRAKQQKHRAKLNPHKNH